jgi:protocatechuate 3,4-dioxygenase beta subunit
MKNRMSSAFLLAAVLSAASIPGGATPIPFTGSVKIPRGQAATAVTAELRSLSQPERQPLPLAVEVKGGTAVLRGAAPEPGLWQVIVREDGAAAMALDLLPLVEESALLPLDLTAASPARRLQVRVTDPAGRPVAGAEVRVAPVAANADAPAGWRPAPAAATTGRDGSAILQAAPSVPLLLAVGAPGFPLHRGEIGPAAQPAVEVRLKPGLPRLIEVRNREDKPVRGVAVTTADGQALGATDERGRLAVAVAAGEALPLRLLAPDGGWARGTVKASADDTGKPAVFLLAPPEELRGQVVDRQTRQPVANALVWVDGLPGTVASTGTPGRYALRLAAGGEVRLRAAAAGYLASQAEAQAPASQAGAPRGPRQVPALALAPAVAVAGLVVDAAGKPLAEVELRAAAADRRAADPDLRARTGPQGTFRLAGFAPGTAYRFSATREGFVPSRQTLTAPDRGAAAAPLKIVLESGRAAAGHVVDTAGRPVAGAEVRLLPAAASEDRRSARETTVRAVSDASGTFRIDRLGRGPFDLRTRAQGFAPTLVRRVDLPAGDGTADLGTLVLERGLTLEGRVVDAGGNPVGGATVQMTPSTGLAVWDLPLDGQTPDWEIATDGDGAFSFAGLAAGGTVTLRASRPGFAARTLPGIAVPSPEPVLVRLAPEARISGTVTDESGEPVAGANVLISESAGDAAPSQGGRPRSAGAAVSDADGRFAAGGLSPGRFTLLATASGYLSATAGGLALPDGGEIAGVAVVLRRGATVQGTVFTPEGAPAAGAKVIALDQGGTAAGQTLVGRPETIADGDGHYSLTGVSEGPHAVLAEHSDYRPARRLVQVQAGTNALDLRLERGAEISGSVAAREGPVAGASVRLMPDDSAAAASPPPPQLSRPDGSFQFLQLGAGRYRLMVEKPGYSMAAPSPVITVAGAPVTGLEVRMERGGTISGRIAGLAFQDLAHVRVVATAPGQPGQAGQVAYDGTYRIDDLAPGAWTVIATLADNGRRTTGSVTLEPGQGEVSLDLELASGFVLSGRVELQGAPVSGALVQVQGADGSGGDTVTGADGRFRVEGLRSGTYALTALQPRSGLRIDQQLKVDGDREIVLVLPAAPRAAPAPRPGS